MILDIDMGNSRVKWRLSDGGLEAGRGACSHQELAGTRGLGDLGLLLQSRPERIRVCSVANSETLEMIQAWAASRFSLPLEVAKVGDGPGGVRCGYRHPAKLGVDRWLAILAAWRRLGESCVVVDAGTALTVDVLLAGRIDSGSQGSSCQSQSGHFGADHLGGYIVPGLNAMSGALYAGTDGVRPGPPAQLNELGPGTDTGAAVRRGCVAMAVALIERVRAQASSKTEAGAEVPVVLTGGDAGSLVQFIAEPVVSVPDLVLDGLAIALPEIS